MASQVRLGSHLGRLGRLGERQGRVWAPTEPRKEGAMHAAGRDREGGGSLRRLQKPYQTAPGILARLNVPGGTVADQLDRMQTTIHIRALDKKILRHSTSPLRI